MGFNPFTSSSGLAKPVLYSPTGLARWRAAMALSDEQVVPVVCVGDSITWGLGSDNTITTTNPVALVKGWCGRLQSRFSLSPLSLQTNPGEGFIFPNDSRVTAGGGALQNLWGCTAFGQGYRLIANTETLSITIPTGVTSIGVIQANQTAAFNAGGSGLADVTGLYNINAGGNTALTALTNTGVPIVTTIAVTAGQVFEVVGPATAQTYISGFLLNNEVATGIQVHRVGLNGAVSGSLLGGQSSGVLQQTSANQVYAARACYQWAPTPGLIIASFTVNDQQFSLGGGVASQNDVTLPLYQAWNLQFASQAVADGWSVLFMANLRDVGYTGYATLDQYCSALKTLAINDANMAYIDVGEVWGGYTESQAAGVQVSGSVHPNTAGCGDMANMLYAALQAYASSGITETIAG
jgi:hypothetical protein